MNKAFTLIAAVFLVCVTALTEDAVAQDIHFSQMHATPMHLNPSYAGVFNGDVRVIAIYKNQWQNVTAKFNTFGVSCDFKAASFNNRDFLGVSVAGYMDKAGDLRFTNYTANVGVAYTKSLSRWKNHGISLGIYGGVIDYGFDVTKAHAFDYEPSFNGIKPNKLTYDVGLGLSGFFQIGRFSSVYGGFGLYHLNMPNISMSGSDEKLYMRYNVSVGAELANKSRHAFLPSVLFSRQGRQMETSTGTFYRFEVNKFWKGQSNYLYIGAWARWYVAPQAYSGIDAIIFALRYDYQNWKFAFSYDVNVSKLATASHGNGGPEVSIIYTHQRQKKHGNKVLFCPHF